MVGVDTKQPIHIIITMKTIITLALTGVALVSCCQQQQQTPPPPPVEQPVVVPTK